MMPARRCRRRSAMASALGAIAGAPFARQAFAQGFPSRPIRFIAPYAPGGGVDTTARLLAGPMGAFLGQPLVVENRSGAGGALGAAELARSAPDGHTIMVDASAHVVNPALLTNLSFDYSTAFAPISQVVLFPLLLIVGNAVPARSVEEFVALLRVRPGELSYGSSGNATSNHLAAELLLRRAGLRAVHVPYRGGPLAMQDLLAGNIAFTFGNVASSMQLVREGRVRALGVATAARLPALPDLPTIAAQGFPGYEFNEWNGLFAPAGTPAAVVARLHAAARHALADGTVLDRLNALGAIPLGSDPESFARFLAEQRAAMAQLVREVGIRVN